MKSGPFSFSSDPRRIGTLVFLLGGLQAGGKPISFNESIQPILSENCYHCHGPDSGTREPKSLPLRLDRDKYAFGNRENGKPVIVKGDPGASLLIKLLKTKNPDELMPPPDSHRSLTTAQISTIEKWVAEGAVYEDHWSFIAPKRPALPAAAYPDKITNPIDAFLQAELSKTGLKPAPAEDPRVLIRRASLDLTGLLPDPADVEAFAANPSEEAYRAYLAKLFATPAYAEHRARYWLDYSRYADTHGLHFDNVRAIWPYRDYVVRSFAANKPFDAFVREQLAGDLLPAATTDSWIATGYIRCNVTTNEGGTIPEEVLANNTRDRTEAFGAAFLGLTVGCAACHDHKFDPTSQKDFYSLSAFFNNTAERAWDENVAESAPVMKIPAPEKRPEFDAAVARRTDATAKYDERRKNAPDHFRQWLAAGNAPRPIPPQNLELRLRLNEGKGTRFANSAPGSASPAYETETNPPVWGESVWLWPSARMDINTSLPMPDQGDFEVGESFSAGLWVNLRLKPGGTQTGDGALIARMGDSSKDSHRGWEMLVSGGNLLVDLIHLWPQQAIRVEAPGIPRGEWVHLGFSYDGSGKAAGVKVYVNGEERAAKVSNDSLQPGATIRTGLPLHLGQRAIGERLRESAYQDVRVYRRDLSADEFRRMPFEDTGAEIFAAKPDPATWTDREKFILLDRVFLQNADPIAVAEKARITASDAEIAELGKGGAATLITRERAAPATAWVLDRGVYTARKELVSPSTPEFLPAPGKAKSRLELAEWLFKAENPLFARVTVNRAWQEVFGVGLVETSDDFGIMGARPSNQALLDWLAVEFRESGWDVRHLYELLLTSNAYRQSNRATAEALAADPANRLLSRGPRFRMDAEMLRDTALQVAGLLSKQVGGPPVKPYQPSGVWEAVSMPESNTKAYQADKGEALYRRSMYTFWKRFAPPPSLETFDAQARETVCIRRARTNTPLQALVSMNDPQFFESARKLAERTILHSPDEDARLAFMATAVLSRPMNAKETALLKSGLAKYRDYYTAHPADAKELLTTGEAPANAQLDPVEIAVWAMVGNQFLNFDEALTK